MTLHEAKPLNALQTHLRERGASRAGMRARTPLAMSQTAPGGGLHVGGLTASASAPMLPRVASSSFVS